MADPTATKPLPQLRPMTQTQPVASKPKSALTPLATNGDQIVVPLGIGSLIDVDAAAYVSVHAQIELTQQCRAAVKRLALTLDQRGEKLSDGSFVKSSIPKAVVWLCERLADAVAE